MSVFNVSGKRAFKAGADLSAAQYHLVKLDGNGDVVKAAAATDAVIGILQNAPKSGDTADVMLLSAGGTSKLIVGASVARGAQIVSNAAGRGITGTQAIAGAQPTSRVCGVVIKTGGADGETAEVMLTNYLF